MSFTLKILMNQARMRSESQIESKTIRVKNSNSYQSATSNGSMHFASNSKKSNVLDKKNVRAHVRSCSDNASNDFFNFMFVTSFS